jgi:integrase
MGNLMKLVSRLSPGLFLVAQHLIKVSGVYYYNRKYPAELRERFGDKVRKKVSLRTKDHFIAARKASQLAAQDDALWSAMRGNDHLAAPDVRKAAAALIAEINPPEWEEENPRNPGEFTVWPKSSVLTTIMEQVGHPSYGTAIHDEAIRILGGKKSVPLLSDALEVYLREHKNSDDKQFVKVTRYGLDLVFSKLGDRQMDAYSRQEITEWRDHLLTTTSTGTFKRRLDSIRAVFRKACAEFQLSIPNPFERLTIRGDGLDATQRDTYTVSELVLIKKAVEARDDDIRWLVGLQIETGARLGELVGLRSDDVKLDHAVPHLKIRPQLKLGRKLKNKQPERDVPLVGVSLWAASRALVSCGKTGWLFPRYASDTGIKSTYASNTLVKWLKKTVGREGGLGNHSFRHSISTDFGTLDALRKYPSKL